MPVRYPGESPRWCTECGEALTPDEIKDGICNPCADEMYWSIKDKQLGKTIHAGRNSATKEDALDGAWDMWAQGAQEEFTEKELQELYENVEEWLETIGFVPYPHREKLPEDSPC